VEFNRRNFNDDENKDNSRDSRGGFNRENRDGGGGFRERTNFNRDNRDGGGGFRERASFNRDGGGGGGFQRDGGGGFNRDNRDGGGGGFRKEFRRDDRPARPQHELVYSTKFRAGKRRTYFFDVRKTDNGDHYLTLTESTQKMNGGYDRHKIFLYKEDFNRFVREIGSVVEHIKNDLQPDYDYDEFERRQLEWEEQRRLEAENAENEADEVENENEENTDEDPEFEKIPEIVAEKEVIVEKIVEKKVEEAPIITQSKPLDVEDEDMSW
jgi:hypothetical protein